MSDIHTHSKALIAPLREAMTLDTVCHFAHPIRDMIRGNRVLVDLLDAYRQLGVDLFKRLREFNKARNLGRIDLKGRQH